MCLVRHQRVEVQLVPGDAPLLSDLTPLSRAQRAHVRLSWEERLVRNACTAIAAKPTITLFGVPDAFAAFLGLRPS